MAYNLMKRIILAAIKDGTLEEKKSGIMDKLDAFLAADRLTAEQYAELMNMLNTNGGTENE